MLRLRTAWWWVGVSLLASHARADVVPGGYVERCTLEKACPSGSECVVCATLRFEPGQGAGYCEGNLKPLGFALRCGTPGLESWSELWCRPSSGPSDATVMLLPSDAGAPHPAGPNQTLHVTTCKQTSPSDGGCTTAGRSQRQAPSLLGEVALLLLLVRFGQRVSRRRKRARGIRAAGAACAHRACLLQAQGTSGERWPA